MRNNARVLASVLAASAALTLTTTPAFADDVDWTGGHDLPPGTPVPYEPGYGTAWRSYNAVKFGDRDYFNRDVDGIRVLGQYDQDSIICLMTMKGGLGTCYVDNQPVTDIAYAPYGKVVTVDPVVKPFTPVIAFFIKLQRGIESLKYRVGSSSS